MSRRLRIVDAPATAEDLQLSPSGPGPEDLAEAEQRGYQRGLADGQAAATAQATATAERLSAIEKALGGELERIQIEVESHAIEAALRAGVEIARRILEREVSLDPTMVTHSVKGALERLPDAGEVEIRVHPDEIEAVQLCRDLRDAGDGGHVRWMADDSVDRGGCVVIADAGVVDARLRVQLARVKDHLFSSSVES